MIKLFKNKKFIKIRFFGRTIEIANRINIDSFNNEKMLIGVSFRKQDFKEIKNIKKLILYCLMPYKWLDKQFCQGKL